MDVVSSLHGGPSSGGTWRLDIGLGGFKVAKNAYWRFQRDAAPNPSFPRHFLGRDFAGGAETLRHEAR
jgi:hypothetical protein